MPAKGVEEFASAVNLTDTYPTSSMMEQVTVLAQFGHSLPGWWTRARDQRLSTAWMDGMLLSAFMFAATTKVANMPLRVVARDPNVESHVRMAEELTEQFRWMSEFGEGIHVTLSKFASDYFGLDNGGFMEIVAPGPTDTPLSGVPLGLRHLDSLYCYRQGDPVYPVRFLEPDGKWTTYHYSRVISMAQMASPRRNYHGVGLSAVSRSIEIAVRYTDMNRYVRGKIGGIETGAILVGKNIGGREILKGIAASSSASQALGLTTTITALGGTDIEVSKIDLQNFPEYDEEAATRGILGAMALAWGLEFNEVFPVASSRANEEVALQRSRGKMPIAFISQLETQGTFKLVPRQLRVIIDLEDDFLDQQREIIGDIRARNLSRLTEREIVSPFVARRRLLSDGYISPSDHLKMSLEEGLLPDGTPLDRVFMDPDYDDLLTIDREILKGEADVEVVRQAVYDNLAVLYRLYAETTALARHERYRTAIAALEKVLNEYTMKEAQEALLEQQMGQQEDSQEDSGPDGRDSGQDTPREVAPDQPEERPKTMMQRLMALARGDD